MKAVVLVGGEGTRLRPLTLHTPKQLLRVVGFPMLERVLSALHSYGVDEAVLSLGYQPEAFLAAYPDGVASGVRLRYAVEERPLDTAGAIRFAAETAGIDSTFVVVNGDILTDLDVQELVAFHGDHGAEATIGLVRVEDPSNFGVVEVDESGRALRFVEKPKQGLAPSNEINAGVYVLDPSVLDRIAFGEPMSIERELFPKLVAEGRLYAKASTCYWLDAGTPRTFRRAALDILFGRRRRQLLPLEGAIVEPFGGGSRCYVGREAALDTGAVLGGSVIEDGVEVGPGAMIEHSIVLEGARIGAGASIVDSIVGAGTVVPENVSLTELSVVARSTPLEPGAAFVGSARTR